MNPGQNRLSIYHKLVPGGVTNFAGPQRRSQSLHRKPSSGINAGSESLSGGQTPVPRNVDHTQTGALLQKPLTQPLSPAFPRRVSYVTSSVPQVVNQASFLPASESVEHTFGHNASQQLPDAMTADDFTHAVAVATVSALRQQQTHFQSPARARVSEGVMSGEAEGGSSQGGHDAPSWSRTISASVLLTCTALYALIAGGYFLKFLRYLVMN